MRSTPEVKVQSTAEYQSCPSFYLLNEILSWEEDHLWASGEYIHGFLRMNSLIEADQYHLNRVFCILYNFTRANTELHQAGLFCDGMLSKSNGEDLNLSFVKLRVRVNAMSESQACCSSTQSHQKAKSHFPRLIIIRSYSTTQLCRTEFCLFLYPISWAETSFHCAVGEFLPEVYKTCSETRLAPSAIIT